MICNREQIFWFLAGNLEGFHIHVMYLVCLSPAIFLKGLALLFQDMYDSLLIACKIANWIYCIIFVSMLVQAMDVLTLRLKYNLLTFRIQKDLLQPSGINCYWHWLIDSAGLKDSTHIGNRVFAYCWRSLDYIGIVIVRYYHCKFLWQWMCTFIYRLNWWQSQVLLSTVQLVEFMQWGRWKPRFHHNGHLHEYSGVMVGETGSTSFSIFNKNSLLEHEKSSTPSGASHCGQTSGGCRFPPIRLQEPRFQPLDPSH